MPRADFEALHAAGIQLKRWRPGAAERARCPQCDRRGHDDALSVRIDDDGRGATWLCHRCGWAGGVRDGTASAPAPVRQHRPPAADVQHQSLSDWGRRLWTDARLITADGPAGRYLSARGCRLPHPDGDLRWHPALRHFSGHVGPALVALVTDVVTAEPVSLHRTWITDDGSGRKAAIDKPRVLLKGHRKAGGCIRLWPDDEVSLGLGLAEGIETALTLARAFTPVWAAIDAGNLGAFPVLDGIESITVAVDHDPAGQKSFDALASRWATAGREVRRVMAPAAGDDLNDWAAGIDHAHR